MWIHKGNVQRLAINNNCVFKESLEMVISIEHNVAYVELWTKEHQSDIRQRPVADIFATIYFWKSGQNGLEKKVLQLENINGCVSIYGIHNQKHLNFLYFYSVGSQMMYNTRY